MAQADIITNQESSALVRQLSASKLMEEDNALFLPIERQYNEAGYVTSHQLQTLREIRNRLEFAQIDN